MAITVGKRGSKISFTEEINATVNPTPEVKENTQQQPKNKGGRPSNGEVKKISLSPHKMRRYFCMQFAPIRKGAVSHRLTGG